jgi:N-formylglutamate amidohydrolase
MSALTPDLAIADPQPTSTLPLAPVVDGTPWFTLERGDGPLVAVALHAGHAVRAEVGDLFALSDEERRREEDAYTHVFTSIVPTRLIAHRSRFEVDLNRPLADAVYRGPVEAWGLEVWRRALPATVREGSLAIHDAFYRAAHTLLGDLAARHGRFLVLDLHSYNHRRQGPGAPPEDPLANPEINLGTATVHDDRWRPVIARLTEALRGAEYRDRRLDVRENVRFLGGYFPRWVNETFRERGCCVAIEVKKFFVDEWSGELDPLALSAVVRVLAEAVPALHELLEGG